MLASRERLLGGFAYAPPWRWSGSRSVRADCGVRHFALVRLWLEEADRTASRDVEV